MKRNSQAGVALLSAILVLMLMSALLVGFIAMVNADQQASGINRDQTQAYAAAHAGVEKLTADLGQMFTGGNFAPTGAQIATLSSQAMQPVLPGITYVGPNNTTGYTITFTDTNGDGNPDVENPNGSQISSGPYQGLVGLITPYEIQVTARTTGNAEVRMRRTMQTIGIPVFQFGIFSENDQSFFAGPNFNFGGRVHTNQHLWLKQDDGATLTLQDRVTAVGEVIRTELANGVSSHFGTVRMSLAPGCPGAPAAPNASCRNLAQTEGSLVGTLGTAQNEPTWTNISMGVYNGWIRNGRTGVRRLDLPLVSDGATPVDLIRRAAAPELPNSPIGRQRFHNMATLRILLSDRPEDLTNIPGVVWTPNVSPRRLSNMTSHPVPLADNFILTAAEAAVPGNLPQGQHRFAESTGVVNNGFRTTAGTSTIDGFILINRQDRNGNWTDVTKEILNLGFAGRRLSANNAAAPYAGLIDSPDLENSCPEAHPNAVIRVQRVRDTFNGSPLTDNPGAGRNGCGAVIALPNLPSTTATDYWPNVLYDPREGMLRDDENNRPVAPAGIPNVLLNQPRVWWGGVMHYVELDVNNLRRWLTGAIGSSPNGGCANGAGPATCPMDVTGFVVYFSDRRGNRNFGPNGVADAPVANALTGLLDYGDDQETGEFGFEDNINPGDPNSRPNGVLDAPFVDAQGVNRWSEDVSGNGVLEAYGGSPRLLPFLWMSNVNGAGMTPFGQGVAANFTLFGTPAVYGVPIDRNTARVNRAFFFRRALKLVNGGRGNLPANNTQGLTVAAENPVYVQGNYNACTNVRPGLVANAYEPACVGGTGFGANPGVDHVSAAIIADSVTLLSNSWNDIRSFNNPHDSSTNIAIGLANSRQAATTWYRLGIIAGKPLNFPRPTNNNRDNEDFGTDGGAHNFLRYIERWGGETLNYRGSILSFYTSRQAVGTYKCCNIVYSPPTRGYNFDVEFLNPNLLPPRTPMFRDVNTLTFRQILRPTQ